MQAIVALEKCLLVGLLAERLALWPDFAITDFEASPFIWEFFKRHPLP